MCSGENCLCREELESLSLGKGGIAAVEDVDELALGGMDEARALAREGDVGSTAILGIGDARDEVAVCEGANRQRCDVGSDLDGGAEVLEPGAGVVVGEDAQDAGLIGGEVESPLVLGHPREEIADVLDDEDAHDVLDDLLLAVVKGEVLRDARRDRVDILFLPVKEDMGGGGEQELAQVEALVFIDEGTILNESLAHRRDEVRGDLYSLLGDGDIDVAAVDIVEGPADVAGVDQMVNGCGDGAGFEEERSADVADGLDLVRAYVEQDARLGDVETARGADVLVYAVVEQDKVIDPVKTITD